MSETLDNQEFNLDGLDFSSELLGELDAIEPLNTDSDESEPEQQAKADYSGAKGEMTAEWLVEMIEAGFKSFVAEDYALPDKKKAVIVKNFTPVMNKYDGGLIGLLGDYKEEGQALFALAMLCFTMWVCVKETKQTKKRSKKADKKPVKDDKSEDEVENGKE